MKLINTVIIVSSILIASIAVTCFYEYKQLASLEVSAQRMPEEIGRLIDNQLRRGFTPTNDQLISVFEHAKTDSRDKYELISEFRELWYTLGVLLGVIAFGQLFIVFQAYAKNKA